MNKVDIVTGQIVGGAIRVHNRFGPGLFESVYTPCLAHELVARGLEVEQQKPLSIQHDGMTIHRAFVLDMLLEVGLIINFNVMKLVDGVKRVVNNYQEQTEGDQMLNSPGARPDKKE